MEQDVGVSGKTAGDALLRKLREGDAAAARELMERYRPLVAAAARRIVRSREDVDDVVQETFVVLLLHASRIRHPERLATWLWTTATNQARRTARRNDRLRPVEDVTLRAGLECPDGVDFDRTLVREEGCRALRKAMATLSADDRTLIGLLTVEDRPSYAAISEATHRPIGSLGPTRHRILSKLRNHPALAGAGEMVAA